MGKIAAERLHQTFAHRTWQASEPVTLLIGRVPRVSSEQFVATVARKNNLDVFARELRYHVGWNRGRIRKRLVEVPGKFVDHFTNIGSYNELVMLGAEFLRRETRVLQLVITVLMKTNRESLDGSIAMSGHQTYDGARINSAGEKRSQWHVRNQAHTHGFIEQRAQFSQTIFFILKRLRLRLLVRKIPVLLNLRTAILKHEVIPGG